MLFKLPLVVPLFGLLSSCFIAAQNLGPGSFKNVTVSRGLVYSYYVSPPSQVDNSEQKPTLVLLHGWPSSSFDWRNQVTFFEERGYSIIVPDMLGYGGTSKPTDPLDYKSSLISRDIVDILDAEDTGRTIVIGHDWGAKIASRLANYFPDRFIGFGYLAIGYLAPEFFATPYSESLTASKALFGYELFGYWDFLSQPGTPALLQSRVESMLRLAYAEDPLLTITDFAPLGALESWIKANRTAPLPDWMPVEDFDQQVKILSIPGTIEGSLNWYKVVRSSIENEDNQGIPPETTIIKKPVFFGGALKDFIGVAPIMASGTLNHTTNATFRFYPTTHWVQLESKELNDDLSVWIQGLE